MKNNLLRENKLYNSQVAVLIFSTVMVAKMSSLPRIMSVHLHNSIFMGILFINILEAILIGIVIWYANIDGYYHMTNTFPKTSKVLLSVFLLYFFLKLTCSYSLIISYMTENLFNAVSPTILLLTAIIPVLYLANRGIVTIARTAEAVIFPIIILLLLGLAFYDAELDFHRLMPFFSQEPKEFFKVFGSYGYWIGDLLPLMFIRMKKKKFPYITVTTSLVFVKIMVVLSLAIATFGEAIQIVNNLMITIPMFNQLSASIGRLEWLGIIPWFFMVIFYGSMTFWAIAEIQSYVFNSKKILPLITIIGFLVLFLAVPSLSYINDIVTIPVVSYFFYFSAFIIPFIMLILGIIGHKRNANRKLNKAEALIDSNKIDVNTNPDPIATQPKKQSQQILQNLKKIYENVYSSSYISINNPIFLNKQFLFDKKKSKIIVPILKPDTSSKKDKAGIDLKEHENAQNISI